MLIQSLFLLSYETKDIAKDLKCLAYWIAGLLLWLWLMNYLFVFTCILWCCDCKCYWQISPLPIQHQFKWRMQNNYLLSSYGFVLPIWLLFLTLISENELPSTKQQHQNRLLYPWFHLVHCKFIFSHYCLLCLFLKGGNIY